MMAKCRQFLPVCRQRRHLCKTCKGAGGGGVYEASSRYGERRLNPWSHVQPAWDFVTLKKIILMSSQMFCHIASHHFLWLVSDSGIKTPKFEIGQELNVGQTTARFGSQIPLSTFLPLPFQRLYQQ